MLPSKNRVIMLEFNELVPNLMDQFISEGHLPHFAQLRRESQIYVTDAEETGERLNPWVQWVTVHTGLSASEHAIMRLSEGHTLAYKAIWDWLSDAGYRVWVCGSMNARYDKPLNGFLLPDPWSTGLAPYPATEFKNFDTLIRFSVQEHTNATASLSKRDTLRFVEYMLSHGLSAETIFATIRQLWTERVTKKFRWKRATILDRMQFDVFKHYFKRYKPDFSTFFINSTAHFQHDFWRNMDPDSFTIKPTAEEQAELRDAVLYGYKMMDRLVRQFLKLAGTDTTLIFCTGLSQQPYLKYEDSTGRHYYRIRDPRLLISRLGINESFSYHPVMASEFCLRFADRAAAEHAARIIQEHRIGDRCAFAWNVEGTDLSMQCSQTGVIASDAIILRRDSGERIPFFEVFYKLDVVKSGYHHPDGMLWVRSPDRTHAIHQQKVALNRIAPAVLKMFGVAIPGEMAARPFDENDEHTEGTGTGSNRDRLGYLDGQPLVRSEL